jgi:hypothetical protein
MNNTLCVVNHGPNQDFIDTESLLIILTKTGISKSIVDNIADAMDDLFHNNRVLLQIQDNVADFFNRYVPEFKDLPSSSSCSSDDENEQSPNRRRIRTKEPITFSSLHYYLPTLTHVQQRYVFKNIKNLIDVKHLSILFDTILNLEYDQAETCSQIEIILGRVFYTMYKQNPELSTIKIKTVFQSSSFAGTEFYYAQAKRKIKELQTQIQYLNKKKIKV